MNMQEAEAILRMIAAAWPSPQMTDDEAARWAVRCLDVTFDEAAQALLDLERVKHFRPSWAEVYALIRIARRRAEPTVQALPAPADTYREIGKHHVKRLLKELAETKRTEVEP